MADDLGKALIDSATSDTIKDLAADALELGADALTDNEALKAIPVFGTLLKVLKGIMSFRDYQFTKVLIRFLQAYSKVSDEKRTDFLIRMEDEPDLKRKIGEKLVLILSQLDDFDKAEVLGNLFKAYVEGAFNLTVFYRLAGIVDKAFMQDLRAYSSDKVREQNVLEANARGQYDFASFVKQHGPKREYNEFDLSNAGFLLKRTYDESRTIQSLLRNPQGQTNIVTTYELNVYGAFLLKFGMLLDVSLKKWQHKFPKY